MDIRVAIVEDNASVREGLGAFIGMIPGLSLVANCPDAHACFKALPDARPYVVLMDINLPDVLGIECVRRLRAVLPKTQFIMLTIEEDSRRVFESLEAGAHGYLVKSAQPDRIIEAIREVHAGGSPVSPQIARMLVQRFQTTPTANAEVVATLTQREEQILHLVAKGCRAKEIADELEISVHTVQTHVRNIYEKLHVRYSAEAVAKYLK